jgi:hypothetical protein
VSSRLARVYLEDMGQLVHGTPAECRTKIINYISHRPANLGVVGDVYTPQSHPDRAGKKRRVKKARR